MKKLKWFSSLLLSAVVMASSVSGVMMPVSVVAEEEYYEDEDYEDEYYEDEYNEDDYSEDDYSEEEHHEEEHFVRDPHVDTNEIEGWPQAEGVDADSGIVMDASTGAILFGKYVDAQKYPASITKIMTVLLALENGNLSDTVKFSENAVYSIEFGSAHLGLTEGEELTLEQCLYGIMLASANEISNAVAEHIGGSVEAFADMMNAKAKELGCENTHFANPNGLHDPEHYVSAKDMALITREALKYDKFREIINTHEYHYPPTNKVKEDRYFQNHHSFLIDESYDGIIGGKTGYTDEAYNTLVTCAERDGMTLISVVLHAPGIESEYGDTRRILDYGFENFEEVPVNNITQAKTNLTIKNIEDPQEQKKIEEADFSKEPFTFAEDAVVTVPKGTDLSKLTTVMNFETGVITYKFNGQNVGKSSFTYTGQWEPETESEIQTEAVTETETEPATEANARVQTIRKILSTLHKGIIVINDLIEGHDTIAVIVGAVLLVIFIPLLIVYISRQKRYKKIMRKRLEELQMRKRMEEEIERQSAAQVEAELRARALAFEMEQEKKKSEAEKDPEQEENNEEE